MRRQDNDATPLVESRLQMLITLFGGYQTRHLTLGKERTAQEVNHRLAKMSEDLAGQSLPCTPTFEFGAGNTEIAVGESSLTPGKSIGNGAQPGTKAHGCRAWQALNGTRSTAHQGKHDSLPEATRESLGGLQPFRRRFDRMPILAGRCFWNHNGVSTVLYRGTAVAFASS
jgi:hypothetical protein